MDQIPLVTEQIEEGQRLLDRLAEAGVPISAAAWIKGSESGTWKLYLVTPLVGEEGPLRPAYRRINTALREIGDPLWGERLGIRVFSPSSPFGEAISRLHSLYGSRPLRYSDYRLGDASVDGAYIYPPIAPVAKE